MRITEAAVVFTSQWRRPPAAHLVVRQNMKSLAETIVEDVAFLELCGDEVIDPDSAVQAMESISHILRNASEEERRALFDYCQGQGKSSPRHDSSRTRSGGVSISNSRRPWA